MSGQARVPSLEADPSAAVIALSQIVRCAYRWGDAPVRFAGLSVHLPANKIKRVAGCHHP